MSVDVFTFEKTCQERLEEFQDILCSRKAFIEASAVFYEWKLYLELMVEPCGWQSLWKISAARCKELAINFPTIVIVKVESVDFTSLCATVKTVAVQDEISLPAMNEVPLQQLFPMRDQREDFLDLERTACGLDQLRFFIAHIWRPWDLEDGPTVNWAGEHLEARLQLHEDISKGVVIPETGMRIRSLVREGCELQLCIDNLSDEESCGLLNDSAYGNDSVCEIVENKEQSLTELEARKQIIIGELAMLENPDTRRLLERKQTNKTARRRKEGSSAAAEACFVWHRGTAKELVDSLGKAQKFLTNDTVLRCVPCAQDALDQSLPGDTVLLCAGHHDVASAAGLQAGGALRGESKLATLVDGPPTGQMMLDFSPSGRKVSLLSLTLSVGSIQLGVMLRAGMLVLEDCDLVGDSGSGTQRGIIVLSGALLAAKNCNFSGLGTAIDVRKGGSLEMSGCLVTKSGVGIQVEEGGWISLTKSRISACGGAGVKVVTQIVEDPGSSGKTESAEILEKCFEFKLEGASFEENTRDVLVIGKHDPIEGLYDEEDLF